MALKLRHTFCFFERRKLSVTASSLNDNDDYIVLHRPTATFQLSNKTVHRTFSLQFHRLASTQTRKMSSGDDAAHPPVVVALEDAKAFIQRCMNKAGATAEHSRQMAEVLIMADHRGHFSHGLNRLGNKKKNWIHTVLRRWSIYWMELDFRIGLNDHCNCWLFDLLISCFSM